MNKTRVPGEFKPHPNRQYCRHNIELGVVCPDCGVPDEEEPGQARGGAEVVTFQTMICTDADLGRPTRHPACCHVQSELAALTQRAEAAEQERDRLRALVREWLCEDCNTVYPGPPQPKAMCVVCPRCGGSTIHASLQNDANWKPRTSGCTGSWKRV